MPIFDQVFGLFGYEKKSSIDQKKVVDSREIVIKEIAKGIGYDMKYYNSWLSDYYNPNPIIDTQKWRQEGGYRALEKLDLDPKVYSCMSTRKEALISRPVFVRSARPGDRLEDLKAALVAWNFDYIKQFGQKRKEILSHLDYGFSVTEMIFEPRTVEIEEKTKKKNGITTKTEAATLKNAKVIRDLETKIPSAFFFDGEGSLYMASNEQPNLILGSGAYRKLTAEEMAHFIVLSHDPRFGSKYGTSLKVPIFFDVLMKRSAKIYRMIFVEKYGMPYLVGKYPESIKSSGSGGIVQLENLIRGLQKNSWIVSPEEFAIEFVNAMEKTGSMDVYQNVLNFADCDISEVILGHRYAADSGSGGSYGAADVKEAALRQDKLESDSTEHDSAFNDQFIRRLIDMNFTPNGLYPYAITDVQQEQDKNKRVFQFAAVSNLGMELSKSQIRDELKINEPEDPADTLFPVGVDMSPTDIGKDSTAGGENSKNTEISDGVRKSAQKLGNRNPGITMSIQI